MRKKEMNVAYAIWFENLNSPILRGQVFDVLKEINKMYPKDEIYLFAFQPFYTILTKYKEFRKTIQYLKTNKIHLVIIPCLTVPWFNFFNAKWYVIPLVFLQSFFALIVLIFFIKIEILHCRSYHAMLAAVVLKKMKKKLKIIFDPRSPFPEENITAGEWTEYSLTYRIWKKLEKIYLDKSNITIAIVNTYIKHFKKISVQANFRLVPNNVDIAQFKYDDEFRFKFRKEKGIINDIIFCYCGSLPSHWNDPEVYAKFLIKFRESGIKHSFLFITPHIGNLRKTFNQFNICEKEYFAISSIFSDIPKYLSIADFGLNLMKNQDIRMSIKTSEYLAMGLPIIVNSKVLGAKEIVEQYGVGVILENFENIDFKKIKNLIGNKDELANKCRTLACEKFSTKKIAEQYGDIYNSLR